MGSLRTDSMFANTTAKTTVAVKTTPMKTPRAIKAADGLVKKLKWLHLQMLHAV